MKKYLTDRIKDLRAADDDFCAKRWDMKRPLFERDVYREHSNEATARRQELENALKELDKKRQYVYEFRFNVDIHEGALSTISIHCTYAGAYKAMNKYLNMKFTEHREECIMYGKSNTLDHLFKYEYWCVTKSVLED